MKQSTWVQRLSKQLPGWHVWYWGSGGTSGSAGYYAVPSPPEATHDEVLRMPNRLGPYSVPQHLRAAALERYGWDDHCETCGELARECGHRTPETRDRPPGRATVERSLM